MIGQTISHYKILEKLGEGGMGVVYLAQDLKLDRQVALKFLPEKLVADATEKERFVHEAKATSALNHPNVTTIHEIDEHDGQLFIAMEYCPGQSVKELIEGEALTLKKTLDIAVQICEGLTAAHKKDVVHRDIKSDNIMVTPEGRVKIMDFGLAKLKGATKLTSTGSTLGTVSYMSPEQAQAMEVDHRSDVFSFGVVLYEMITGHLPFGGDHEAAVIYSIVNQTPEPLARYKADVPEGLQRIVDKALEKDRKERYQHIDGVLADLRREKRILESGAAGRVPSGGKGARQKKTRLSLIVPAAVIVLVVILFFILKPFQVKIGPQPEAIAQENSMAIMYFENLADREDPERLGEIVTNLLITDLSESQYMRVISSQRLYDILKLQGREGIKVIDRDVASEVANKAGVKLMLLGSILQVDPHVVLTSQLVDVYSGKVLASQRIAGERGAQIFSLVDKLTVEVKKDLSLPTEAQREMDPEVADVTTHSAQAYRCYVEGLDYDNKAYWAEAAESYGKALEFDSTFAMAYYRLASLKRDVERQMLTAKALRYSEKISRKEKYYIRAWEAYISGNYSQAIVELQKIIERYTDEKEAFSILGVVYEDHLGEPEKAIQVYLKAIEIDPLYKWIYNQLAYAYDEIGDFEKSIWAINKYISLAPDEANPYDTKGDLCAHDNKIDQAIESYEQALKIKPDFSMSLKKLGYMYLFRREYAKSESCYKELATNSERSARSVGRSYLACIPLYQGKFADALQTLDDGIAADRMEQVVSGQSAYKHLLKATVYEEKKEFRLALHEADMCRKIIAETHSQAPVYSRVYYAYLLTKNGMSEEAERSVQALKRDIEVQGSGLMHVYWLALGTVELLKGDVKSAAAHLKKAAEKAPYRLTPSIMFFEEYPLFQVRFFLAQSYLELGRLGEAVAELETALSRYDEVRAGMPISAVKAYYLLGLAYERSGWTDKAIEQYETFLEIWKDADPGIEEVKDARERLGALKARS